MDFSFADLPGPCQPIRMDGLVPVYSTRQVELFGNPDKWGVCCFQVIETRDDVVYMSDYKSQITRVVKPIHRYSRVKRFETTLYQLLAVRGNVPLELILEIRLCGYDHHPEYIWESIRSCLKELKTVDVQKKHDIIRYKTKIFYNRIPCIIRELGHYELKIDFKDKAAFLVMIIEEFKRMSWAFDQLSCDYTYFPNMRFICLKMLQYYGAGINFFIPIIRTKRKYKPLDDLWTKLIEKK